MTRNIPSPAGLTPSALPWLTADLEPPERRSSAQIALNLLEGATVITRAQQLRACGIAVPATAFRFVPRPLA